MLHKARVGGCSPSGIHPGIDGDKIGERLALADEAGIEPALTHVLSTSIRHIYK